MAEDTLTTAGIGNHGAARRRRWTSTATTSNSRTKTGFWGTAPARVRFTTFWRICASRSARTARTPLGDKASEDISKKELDQILVGDDIQAAAVLHGAIEDFAQELAFVTQRFLKTKAWDKTEAIIVGGGFRQRADRSTGDCPRGAHPPAEGHKVEMLPIRFHPDEAALIGCAHLAPSWIFEAHDSILAVDIGGTNIRCGVVETRQKKAPDLSKASVWKSELWRHADDEPTREGAVKKLAGMLKNFIKQAEAEGIKLAPFIGVSCPGAIDADGSIEKGAQNLPGNWESSKFNLPASLIEAIPTIGDHDTAILMHNDGVVQGLSEIPFMQDYKRWGILTIGTGLGNARFTMRNPREKKKG